MHVAAPHRKRLAFQHSSIQPLLQDAPRTAGVSCLAMPRLFPSERLSPLQHACRLVGALVLSVGAVAQQAPPVSSPLTFHVATDLLQIPVLVLSENLQQLPAIDPARFTLSIASGAPFHPQVHREGNDPIALTVLVDISGPQRQLLASLPSALLATLPVALHPHDTLAVDTLNHCLLRHVLPPSSPDARLLSAAIRNAFEVTETKETRKTCGGPDRIWEGLVLAVNEIAEQPARRVIIAVTNGNDTGSSVRWNQLRTFAGSRATTLFALSDPDDSWRQQVFREVSQRGKPESDVLSALCQLTGGLNLNLRPDALSGGLLNIIDMLRHRYILEFPRPQQTPSSISGFEVSLAGMHAFIRPSGIGFPPAVADATQPDGRRLPRPVPGSRVILRTP